MNGFVADYRVRFDEAGPDGQARTSTFLRYAQDVAWRHSEDRGFDRAWYAERGLNWVARAVEIEVLGSVPIGAALQVRTAVIGHRRIWARRLAEVRASGGLVARIVTDWVILDRRGRPARIPADFGVHFANPEIDAGILRAEPADGAAVVSLRLVVRPHELDPLNHVNSATYLDWLEEALVAREGERADLAALPRSARLEYLAAAERGDALEVATWHDGARWAATIRRPGGSDVLRASGRLG